MTAPPVLELLDRLLRAAEPAAFTDAELEGLPEPVRRHLTQAIAPQTPLATSARLRMRGTIKLGRWLPFRAHQVLNPHHGLVWAARVAGVIAGSDRYLDGLGGMDWKLLGLVRVAHATGPDFARSAAGRAGVEGMWVPTALLPRFGVRWTADGPDRVTRYTSLRYRLLARRVAGDIGDYLRSGFAVAGVVGVAGSPSCGVRRTLNLSGALEGMASCPLATLDREALNRQVIAANVVAGEGLFVRQLRRALRHRRVQVPFQEHDLPLEPPEAAPD